MIEAFVSEAENFGTGWDLIEQVLSCKLSRVVHEADCDLGLNLSPFLSTDVVLKPQVDPIKGVLEGAIATISVEHHLLFRVHEQPIDLV